MATNNFGSEESNSSLINLTGYLDSNGAFRIKNPDISSYNFDGVIPSVLNNISASSITPGMKISFTGSTDAQTYYSVVAVGNEGDIFTGSAIGTTVIEYLDEIGQSQVVVLGASSFFPVIYESWEDKYIGNTGWFLSGQGNAIFSNVAVRGEIQATSGNILGDLALGGSLTASNTNGYLILSASGINSVAGLNNFNLDTVSGNLSFTGNINATSGSFVGNLYGASVSGGYIGGGYIKGGTIDSVDIYAGNIYGGLIVGGYITGGEIFGTNLNSSSISSTFINGGFGSFTGQITATSGSFTGVITASAGTIAGFKIGDYFGTPAIIAPSDRIILRNDGVIQLYPGDGAPMYLAALPFSQGRLWFGFANASDSVFWLNNNGFMKAKSASIHSFAGTGSVVFPDAYNTTVTSARDLQIDSTGKIGYVASSLAVKENIIPLIELDTLNIPEDKIGSRESIDFNYKDVLNLTPVQFDWIDGGTELGFIAEQIAEVMPIASISGDIPSYHSKMIIPALLAVVKEQQESIDDLKNRVLQLESQLGG
jgi:hypothetical protein